MLKFVKCLLDVSWHGEVEGSFVVIPFKRDAAEGSSGPVDGDVIKLAECVDEVICVLFSRVFDAKVVNDE